MIKFFRHIRKSLLMETGKTSKYFKYAIGEIILVVIGILIALQINNWNEENKLLIEEKKSLRNLHIEAEDIVIKLEDHILKIDTLLIISEKTVAAFSENRILQMDNREASTGITATSFYATFELPNTIYKELNSSGKLQNLKSDKIKRAISQYYSKLEFVNGQLPYWRDTYALKEDWSNGNLQFTYNPKDEDKSEPNFDFSELQQNKDFNNRLLQSFRNQLVFQSYRKELYSLARDMCKIIAKELNLKCNSL